MVLVVVKVARIVGEAGLGLAEELVVGKIGKLVVDDDVAFQYSQLRMQTRILGVKNQNILKLLFLVVAMASKRGLSSFSDSMTI